MIIDNNNFSKQNLLIAFLISHTINWLINTNFNNLFIHRLYLKKLSKSLLFRYLDTLQNKLISQDWLIYAACFGSISKGLLKESSDLDVSFVRKPGFLNALKALWFILKERKIADFKGIPLEAYINDNPLESMHRFKDEETAVVIIDPADIISHYYKKQITLLEAEILNTSM